jgi:hypothetical protein
MQQVQQVLDNQPLDQPLPVEDQVVLLVAAASHEFSDVGRDLAGFSESDAKPKLLEYFRKGGGIINILVRVRRMLCFEYL